MNKQVLQSNYKEMSGAITKKYGLLSEAEVLRTRGNWDSLVSLVHQRYGISKEDAAADLSAIVEGFEDKFSKHPPGKSAAANGTNYSAIKH